MKKLTALFLALALCLSLCTVTAFADGYKVYNILNMCEGGNFPTAINNGEIPDNAWTDGKGHYMYANTNGTLRVQDNDGNFQGITQGASVTEGENKYTSISKGSNDGKAYSYELVFNMTNKVLTSITATYSDEKEGLEYVAGLSGTYYPPKTIADILDTVKFPQSPSDDEVPSDAWVSDGKVCYLDAYGNFTFKKDDNEFYVDQGASVAKNENNYVWEAQVTKITFIMNEDGELSSIEFYTTNDEYNALNGTYTAPTDDDGHDWDYETLAKGAAIAAGITVVTVGTIHTVKAIKNYKAEKAAAAEAAKLAEMPMVAFGDSGDAVTTLQTELNAQGYACGEVDGIFGQNTLNAVMAFQTAKGLTADGVVGVQTWGALL